MTPSFPPPQSYRFCVERAINRIYQRIIDQFVQALTQLGHTVDLLTPSDFTQVEYVNYINAQAFDFVLITNSIACLGQYWEPLGGYVFEFLQTRVIFIHHDSLTSELRDLNAIRRKLTAFYHHRERSYHFCLEYSNFLDLKSLGMPYVFTIPHASEYAYLPPPQTYQYEVSFVGHVMPALEHDLADVQFSHRVQADVWRRIADTDTRLEPGAIDFATRHANPSDPLEFLSFKHFYMSLLHLYSLYSRGEVIRRIHTAGVDIVGGDPAYLRGESLNRRIESDTIRYHPPQEDYGATSRIYHTSRINLNITALQFDTAVINRVIDGAAVGGFVLTDWRSDLEQLTSVATEISYRSLEELNDKLAYYLHPDHQTERLAIAATLHQDVMKTCTYSAVVEYLLHTLRTASALSPDALRVDLGCGGWKTEGFIGVDRVPGPGIDVVADLTRRFPFADDRVEIVKAHDVVEHLPDRLHTMNEIWRICAPGAIVDLRVPSTDGRGAFQDPTHVSFWNINSFKYYCVEFPPYWHLCQQYGFRGAFTLVSLEEERSEDGVVHVRAILRAIKPVPSSGAEPLTGGVEEGNRAALREMNLLVYPDWEAEEEALNDHLYQLMHRIVHHPQPHRLAVLMAIDGIEPEPVQLLLADMMLSICAEAGMVNPPEEPYLLLLTTDEVVQIAAEVSLTAHLLIGCDRPLPTALVSLPTLSLTDVENGRYTEA